MAPETVKQLPFLREVVSAAGDANTKRKVRSSDSLGECIVMAGATSLIELILKKWGDDIAGAAKELEEKVGFLSRWRIASPAVSCLWTRPVG